jgi:dynein heavy chain
MTEEEWTEQVLMFEPFKKRGPMYLDKSSTERLLEQLEDAQALLAQMLTSRYVGPLREEAASWAEKLKEVGQVLDQWLEVQDLWQYLEAVFSSEASLAKVSRITTLLVITVQTSIISAGTTSRSQTVHQN